MAAPRPSRCGAQVARWRVALAMTRAALRAIGLGLALAALAACGLKGDPRPPEPDETRTES